MLKNILKKIEDLRVKVYAGQSLEDNEKALYEIEQMLLKAMDEQLNIPIVSNCNSKKGSQFEDWLKKQNLKEVVTKEYKWREFVLDEEFVLAKYNEDKQY